MLSAPVRPEGIERRGGVLLWEDITYAVDHVCYQMATTAYRPKTLVALSRGGLVPATMIAHRLGINNVRSFRIGSYGEGKTSGNIQMEDPHRLTDMMNRTVLIVDDLWDTGNTIRKLQGVWVNPSYCTLFHKTLRPHQRPPVDFPGVWMPKDTWLEMPWELKPYYKA